MKLRNFSPNMFHMSRRIIYERFNWRSSLYGDRQGLRAPNTFPVPFKGNNSCYRIQNQDFSIQKWNRGTEYYPVGMKTHIEYPDLFFWKYNSPCHVQMGTYVLIDLLWAGGSVAPAQPTRLRWNWGIFSQTCSTCLEGPYRKDSSGAHPCRAIDRACVTP